MILPHLFFTEISVDEFSISKLLWHLFDVHVGSKPVTLNFMKCFRNCYKLIFEMLKLQGNILSVYQLYYKAYSVLQTYSTWTFIFEIPKLL